MIETNYQLITTPEELRAAVESLKQHPAIGFDTETTDLDPYRGRLRLIQLAAPDGVRIIDLQRFTNGNAENLTNGYLKKSEALAPLRGLLAAARPVKIAHNAKFDAKWTKHTLGVEIGGLFDTLLASQIVSAGDMDERHSLEAVAARYLNETVDKAEQLSDWSGELSERQLEYAARDASVLPPLREKLIERLRADALVNCAQLEFECVLPVASLELAGFYLDKDRWREQLAVVEKKRATLADELQEMLAEESAQGSLFGGPTRIDLNLDSHVQLTRALNRLGVPVPDSTRNWKLQPLAAEYPVVAKLLEYRTMQKALTSYGENVLNEISPVTGRIHADFRQIGAPTGRFACLAGDTLVATPTGLKRMETVRPGDLVKTSYGFKRVEKAWMTGVRRLHQVQLKDGRSIRATGDHRFLTGRGDEWKRLDELKPGDTLYVSLKNPDSGWDERFCPININLPEFRSRKTVSLPTSLSGELCELMGLIVADGFLGKRHARPVWRRRLGGLPAEYDRVYLAFGWQDQQLIDRVIAHSLKLFRKPFTEIKSKTCRTFQLASTKIAQFFAALGLTGNAHTKSVPDLILGASALYQSAFLRGLFEGDGHRTGNHIGLTSVNHQLLAQAQLMLGNLGIYSSIRLRKDQSGFAGTDRFDLNINKKSDIARFMNHVGFISGRKDQPFDFNQQPTDGIATPFKISGAALYREAVAAGTTEASRGGVKPFISYYKNTFIKAESVEKLSGRFGLLPSLEPIRHYLDLEIRPVEIKSIALDGLEKVYDLTVEDVHEFVANGIVVHNCTNPNIQQVPHSYEYRRCFRAPEGRKLIISDYSQIELRILADFTGDQGFVEAFNSGADLHKVTAAQVFSVPLDKVTKEQRDFAKRLNFGVVYGIGAQRFSMMTGLSLTTAEDILRRYFATYRQLDAWLRDAAQRAVRERTARTASGRLARFRFDSEDRQAMSLAQRNGKNTPIQGCQIFNSRILTVEHGYVKIGTLSGLNNLHVWDGTKFVRAKVCPSGKKQKVKVEFWGGYYNECSPDHRFLTIDVNGRKFWRTPAQFVKGHYVVLTDAPPEWSLPLNLPATTHIKNHNAKTGGLDDISNRFDLGVWLGRVASDGNVTGANIRLLIAEHEKEILPYLSKLSASFGHTKQSVGHGGRGVLPLYLLNLTFARLAYQLIELGIKSRAPDCVWKDSRILAGYLRGMFDGDGTVNRDGALLTFGKGPNFHIEWAREIQHALLLFGIRSRISRCADRINVCILKRDMPLFCERIGFINSAKQNKAVAVKDMTGYKNRIYGRAVRIKSVEFTNDWVEMYDVVDSETSQFMVNGLVTHNSSADILKRALRLLHDQLRDTTACIVNIVHDEIVVEADADDTEAIAKKVEDAMCAAGAEYVKKVPVKVETEVADEWVK